MEVRYLNHMGDDLFVVNAARVSFHKEHEIFQSNDPGLINYLARHNHFTPFAHPQISLHFKVPIFVARQIHKHQVGFVVNEVSRRYVSEEPEFYRPELRKRAEDKKQGSGSDTVKLNQTDRGVIEDADWWSYRAYKTLLLRKVAPEVARAYLPLSTYTEFWQTGSLAAWARLYNLRIQPDSQKEVQEVAKQIGEIVAPLFPCSWEALTDEV